MKFVVLIAVVLVARSADAQLPGPANTERAELGVTRSEVMPIGDYNNLVAVASCDWADGTYECEDRDCAGNRVTDRSQSCYTSALTWIGKLKLGDRIANAEPVILFMGLNGVNRIVLLQKNRKAHYRTLGGAHYFWGIFVEEDESPFQTSIDIQFRNRVALDDFEEYDPAGRPEPPAADATERRVRIGYRRFRVRRTPVDVQVTFSRQGAAYGFRQWVKGFTASGPTKAGWAVGGMLPARLLPLREFDVEAAVGVAGERPIALRVIDEGTTYRFFMMLTKTWPRARDSVRESRGGGTAFWKTLVTPEPQIGIGLPQDPFDTVFGGISWPLYRPMRFSLGMTRVRHQRLEDGIFVGQHVPFGNDEKSITTGKVDVQWKFTAGLSIDVVGR